MSKYQRKGTTEAVKWTGSNLNEVKAFLGPNFISANDKYITYVKNPLRLDPQLHFATVGDYFVEGSAGSEQIKYTIDAWEFEREWELASETPAEQTFDVDAFGKKLEDLIKLGKNFL